MTLPKLSPSALFLMTFTAGIVLSWYMPWHISLFVDMSLVRFLGIVLLLVSLTLNTLSYRAFQKYNTPYAPFSHPKILIQQGIFGLSRNPVYLALIVSELGLAFVFDSIWLLLGSGVLFFTLHYLIVRHEEKILAHTFKETYVHYKTITRRWL